MTNANQGFLTLLGLLIAVVAVWTGIATGASNRKRENAEAEARTETAVCDAIDELHHNLQHVAGAYDGDTLRVVPQITVDSTLRLLEPANRVFLSSSLVSAIEPLRRNAERLKELRAASKGPGAVPPSRSDPEPLGGFVRGTLEILLFLWRDHHKWSCKSLQRPGLQDLPRFARRQVYLSFRSSRIQERGPWLRTNEMPLVCWHNDGPIAGVRTYVVGQRFLDAREAHSDH